MLILAIKSHNQFYKLGLKILLEQIVNSRIEQGYKIIKEISSCITKKANIIFTDQMVIVNLFEKQTIFSRGHDNLSQRPHTSIHITFNSSFLCLSEVSNLIKKIIDLAIKGYNQTVKKELYRQLKAREHLQLSIKESRIVMLISQGYDTYNLSKIMACSERTIYSHRRNAIKKLGMINRVQFFRYIALLKEFSQQENIFIAL